MGNIRAIRLLDLCCKAGGCSRGYELAAQEMGLDIEIVGVDIAPQPNYKYEFVQADAIDYIKKYGKKFTHVHASPPCQEYSCSTTEWRKNGKVYVDILSELRIEMQKNNRPGVIENVQGAPMRPDIILRGDAFGLKVLRTRLFECVNWFALSPCLPQKMGSVRDGDYVSVFGKASYGKVTNVAKPKFAKKTIRDTWAYAMGIDWYMTDIELSSAIPPAYTHYIGLEFFKQ